MWEIVEEYLVVKTYWEMQVNGGMVYIIIINKVFIRFHNIWSTKIKHKNCLYWLKTKSGISHAVFSQIYAYNA